MDVIMADQIHSELQESITKNIGKMQKEVTILFTDIEDSTKYWHTFGDVEGRLMVDRHNRILFPLIKKYKGRVVKTIGDSIMAVFKRPTHALNAAIAMQQALTQRTTSFKSPIKIRIGLHTGSAIVEKNDVYGDIVNVAARVESQSEGDKIALSSKTLDALKDKKSLYSFEKGEGFIPKGKSRKMALFFCRWTKHKSLIDGDKTHALVPFDPKQKIGIFIYLLSIFAFGYFLFSKYLRYIISDNELVSSMILNPRMIIHEYPYELAGVSLVLMYALYKLLRLKKISPKVFKILKGGFVASIIFIISFYALKLIPAGTIPKASESIYKTEHLIVTVLSDNAQLKSSTDANATILRDLEEGTLLLLTDVKEDENITWNKVRLQDKEYAWIERTIPEAIGRVEERITKTNNFFIYYLDLYILCLSFLGFIWGYLTFKVKPF